jgi:chromosome segregation ATPase
MFSGAVLAQPGAANTSTDSNTAARLVEEIHSNAAQIRACARTLESLDKSSNSAWSAYDEQWNTIKPAQERIDLAMERLESIEGSLSAADRQTVDQARQDVQRISSATHDLWMRIGQPKPDLQGTVLNSDARKLDRAARDLMRDKIAQG